MTPYYSEDGIVIYHGDCREILPSIEADALVTDPPYGTGWVVGTGSVGEFVAHPQREAWDVYATDWIAMCKVARFAIFSPMSRIVDTAKALRSPTVLYYQKTNARPLAPNREALVVSPAPYRMPSWEMSAYNGDCEYHPCQKPLAVMQWLIAGVCEPDDVVLDCFAGSGSTLVAAKALGHRAIGIEQQEEYCEAAAKRLSQRVLDFEVTQ